MLHAITFVTFIALTLCQTIEEVIILDYPVEDLIETNKDFDDTKVEQNEKSSVESNFKPYEEDKTFKVGEYGSSSSVRDKMMYSKIAKRYNKYFKEKEFDPYEEDETFKIEAHNSTSSFPHNLLPQETAERNKNHYVENKFNTYKEDEVLKIDDNDSTSSIPDEIFNKKIAESNNKHSEENKFDPYQEDEIKNKEEYNSTSSIPRILLDRVESRSTVMINKNNFVDYKFDPYKKDEVLKAEMHEFMASIPTEMLNQEINERNKKHFEEKQYVSHKEDKIFKTNDYDFTPNEVLNKKLQTKDLSEIKDKLSRSEPYSAYNISTESTDVPTTVPENKLDIIETKEKRISLGATKMNDDKIKNNEATLIVPSKTNLENDLNFKYFSEPISNPKTILAPKFLKVEDNSGKTLFSPIEKKFNISQSNPSTVLLAKSIFSNGSNLMMFQEGDGIISDLASNEEYKHPADFSKSTYVGVPMDKLLSMLRSGAAPIKLSRIDGSHSLSSGVMSYIANSDRSLGNLIYGRN